MLYNFLKISHILSATLLLTSMVYSYQLWRQSARAEMATRNSLRIQRQTWSVILPFAILQLATGFTMISLKHENLSQLWISGSVIGFMTVIMSWFAFIYFLVSSSHRKWQFIFLGICTIALLCMIFFMANKIA